MMAEPPLFVRIPPVPMLTKEFSAVGVIVMVAAVEAAVTFSELMVRDEIVVVVAVTLTLSVAPAAVITFAE